MRAKKAFQQLRNGEYYHNDTAKYQIYLQSLTFDTKSMLTRQDVLDIFNRIAKGETHRGTMPLETISVDDLPDFMRDFVKDEDVAKIEYMDGGRYKVTTSPLYEKHFMSSKQILDIARTHHLPPKMVDTCGYNQYDMAYRVWSESLYLPGAVISYTGPALWRGDNKLAWTTMRVMSFTERHDAVVTITLMGRGSSFYG